jgi:hypothetical protein
MGTDLTSQNALTDLAARINAEHGKVKEAIVRGAWHAIEAGGLLWEAKGKVQHGHWLEWLPANCPFSERTAQLYMKLAQDLPRIEAKPQRIADMTLTDAIKMVEDLKNPVEPLPGAAPKRSAGKKTDRVGEAIKSAPLAIMQRAWEAAEENERRLFISRIEKDVVARPATTAVEGLSVRSKLPNSGDSS